MVAFGAEDCDELLFCHGVNYSGWELIRNWIDRQNRQWHWYKNLSIPTPIEHHSLKLKATDQDAGLKRWEWEHVGLKASWVESWSTDAAAAAPQKLSFLVHAIILYIILSCLLGVYICIFQMCCHWACRDVHSAQSNIFFETHTHWY